MQKVTRYGVYSGPYFPAFGFNTTQPAITCSKLTKETLEHGVKYVQR